MAILKRYQFSQDFTLTTVEEKTFLYNFENLDFLFEIQGECSKIINDIIQFGDEGFDLPTLKTNTEIKIQPPLKTFNHLFDDFINSLIENKIIVEKN